MASTKATDAVYHVDPPPAAKKLRELYYCAHMCHSHIAHFYALAAPDFVMGPDADPAQRNILGVVAKVDLEVVSDNLLGSSEVSLLSGLHRAVDGLLRHEAQNQNGILKFMQVSLQTLRGILCLLSPNDLATRIQALRH